MAEPAEPKPLDLNATIAKLTHAEEGIRLAGLGEIVGAKAGPQALDQTTACLDDPSERVRRAAIAVLVKLDLRPSPRWQTASASSSRARYVSLPHPRLPVGAARPHRPLTR